MDPTQREFAHLLAIDAVLLKAAALGPEAVFANMERRLLQFVARVWQERVSVALMAARANWMYGMTAAQLAGAVGKAFKDWEERVRPAVMAVTRDAYTEGKRNILMRAHGLMGPIGKSADAPTQLVLKAPKDPSIETSLSLKDEKAINKLVEGQLHWLGDYYDDELSESIDSIVNDVMLQQGLGREEAGKVLQDKLAERLSAAGVTAHEEYLRGPAAYFELIAANTVSNARVRGSLGQMAQIGVTNFTIVAVGDEKTCTRCTFMDGRTRSVSHVIGIMDQLADADDPESVKQLHPWASTRAEMEADPDKFPMPPFHGICRCTVDIAEDSEITFEPMPGW